MEEFCFSLTKYSLFLYAFIFICEMGFLSPVQILTYKQQQQQQHFKPQQGH